MKRNRWIVLLGAGLVALMLVGPAEAGKKKPKPKPDKPVAGDRDRPGDKDRPGDRDGAADRPGDRDGVSDRPGDRPRRTGDRPGDGSRPRDGVAGDGIPLRVDGLGRPVSIDPKWLAMRQRELGREPLTLDPGLSGAQREFLNQDVKVLSDQLGLADARRADGGPVLTPDAMRKIDRYMDRELARLAWLDLKRPTDPAGRDGAARDPAKDPTKDGAGTPRPVDGPGAKDGAGTPRDGTGQRPRLEPIDGLTPARMEALQRQLDMSAVRVHREQRAQVRAEAALLGDLLHLGPGKERHIPHEIWHIVQQQGGRVRSDAVVGDAPSRMERMAEAIGGMDRGSYTRLTEGLNRAWGTDRSGAAARERGRDGQADPNRSAVADRVPRADDFKLLTAADANAGKGGGTWLPPFPPNTHVTQYRLPKPVKLVRVYSAANGGKAQGSWVVRYSDIRNMTPAQVRDHLGLQHVPDSLVGVTVPAGTLVQLGPIGKQPAHRKPEDGGLQFRLMERVPAERWGAPEEMK